MKLLVLLFSLLCSISSFGAVDLEQPLSLAVNNSTASDFLNELSKQSNIKFVMNGKIKFQQKVSIYVKDESLKKILDGFAQAQNVKWSAFGENTIKISQ